MSKTHEDLIQDLKPVMHYINGEFVPSSNGETFQNISPFTNEPMNDVASGQTDDIDKAVAAAKAAFNGEWRTMKLDERLDYIYKIGDLIEAEVEEIALLESLDTGLPIKQTRKMVSRAALNFRFYADQVKHVMYGEMYPVDDEFVNYTTRQPVGVAGLITPWNAPFMLETWKIAPALATGNTVVLKPAEWSPLSAQRIAEVIDRAGLPDGVFNVVHGIGEVAGDALVKHKDVKLISFTGETKTGALIMRNGADTLKRFSMELGGKSPIIVFEDADYERALDAVIWGIFSFNGERCTANSRLYVQESIKDKFIEDVKLRIQRIKVGDPLDDDTEVGPLIKTEHFKNVKRYIDLAKDEGCEVIQADVPKSLSRGNYVPPTLLVGAENNMRIVQEEIFGPVMAVMSFTDEDDVIEKANDVEYGLAGYVWTSNLARGHRVAQAIDAGMLWVNSQNVRDLRTPFGGAKNSGIGREGGFYAFDFYTEIKIIHVAIGDHHIPKFGK